MTSVSFSTQLQKIYNGSPWYGKNLTRSFEDLPFEKLTHRIEGSYNIVELVHHMLAWKRYTLYVLRNRSHRKVPDQENFPTIREINHEEWHQLLRDFQNLHDELTTAVKTNEDWMDDRLPEKNYTYRDVVQGVIYHDVYHIGQINLLAKFS